MTCLVSTLFAGSLLCLSLFAIDAFYPVHLLSMMPVYQSQGLA
jgi:hypothetical protein